MPRHRPAPATSYAGEFLQPEIGAGIEPHHVHMRGDLIDEGQEQRAVEPAFVEIIRRDVGGRDHHRAELEQFCEQAAEDHRVGDVGDMEFVEAEQPGFVEDRVRGQRDHVAIDKLPRDNSCR